MAEIPDRLDDFFRRARKACPETEGLEAGFEQRVQRRLSRRRAAQPEPLPFATLVWRAAPVCALASLLAMLAAGILVEPSGLGVAGLAHAPYILGAF